MPMEDYPRYKAEGDEVYQCLRNRLAASATLDPADVEAVSQFMAAVYEKALELQYAVTRLVQTDQQSPMEEADLLAFAEIASDVLSQWHDESAAVLIRAVERLREGVSPMAKSSKSMSKKTRPAGANQ